MESELGGTPTDCAGESEVENDLGGTPTHYARAIYMVTRRWYLQITMMTRAVLSHGFTCFGDELSFDAAGVFLSWVRLASHETFIHMGAGTGRLAWHAHLLTRARATSVETTERRAKVVATLGEVARSTFWRCPELLEGVSKATSAHQFITGAKQRVMLLGDVLFLSDLHATRDEHTRLDASLATSCFRVVASYYRPETWRSLRPCTAIEPNSMVFAHESSDGTPHRIFLYERPCSTAPLIRPRVTEVKSRPWVGWAQDLLEDTDSDDTQCQMELEKRL